MSYDSDVMAEIAQELYEFHVERDHGPPGIDALRHLVGAIRAIFLFKSPDSFGPGVTVFRALEMDDDPVDPVGSHHLGAAHGADVLPEGALVQVKADGIFRFWVNHVVDLDELAQVAVVYTYRGLAPDAGADEEASEAILLPSGSQTVRNPVGYPSAFAPPTFWNLDDALTYYESHLAAKATCKLLRKVWATDAGNRRLVLCNTPEVVMRESLAQHLRSSVRDSALVRVNEEQNMSETEPVDIVVTWTLTNQIAIIEVKWLGKCLNADGSDLASYAYTDGRAREGIVQLCGYLDEYEERTPGHEIKGYLAVFDARRRGVMKWEPDPISPEHAWYHRYADIDYQDVIPARGDLMPPRRFYLEPRIAA